MPKSRHSARSVITVQSRSTITLPREVREALDLHPGSVLDVDVVDGRLVLTPMAVVPRTLRLSPSGEVKETEADEDVRAGRVAGFSSAEDLLAELDR